MEKYILYIGILLIISLLLVFFLVFPKYQDWGVLKNEVAIKQAELESQEKYFGELQRISEEIKQYQDNLSKIDTILPPGSELADFYDFLQKVASQSGLALGKIGAGTAAAVEGQNIKETKISIGVTGNYSALKNFIQSLENSARLIEVESITFSSVSPGMQSQEQKQEKDVFSFSLTIKTRSY